MSLAEESEEQAIDRLLGELGIRLPAVEVEVDGEDLSGPISPPDQNRPLRLDEIRGWWPSPSS